MVLCPISTVALWHHCSRAAPWEGERGREGPREAALQREGSVVTEVGASAGSAQTEDLFRILV